MRDDPIMASIELADANQYSCDEMPKEDIEDDYLNKVPILLLPGRVYIVQLQHLYILRSLEHLNQGNHKRDDAHSLSDLHHNGNEDDGNGGDVNEEIEQASRVQNDVRDIVKPNALVILLLDSLEKYFTELEYYCHYFQDYNEMVIMFVPAESLDKGLEDRDVEDEQTHQDVSEEAKELDPAVLDLDPLQL